MKIRSGFVSNSSSSSFIISWQKDAVELTEKERQFCDTMNCLKGIDGCNMYLIHDWYCHGGSWTDNVDISPFCNRDDEDDWFEEINVLFSGIKQKVLSLPSNQYFKKQDEDY